MEFNYEVIDDMLAQLEHESAEFDRAIESLIWIKEEIYANSTNGFLEHVDMRTIIFEVKKYQSLQVDDFKDHLTVIKASLIKLDKDLIKSKS